VAGSDDPPADARPEFAALMRFVRPRRTAALALLFGGMVGALGFAGGAAATASAAVMLVGLGYGAYVRLRYLRCPRCGDHNHKYVGRYCRACGCRLK
jgi:hypothetical protein